MQNQKRNSHTWYCKHRIKKLKQVKMYRQTEQDRKNHNKNSANWGKTKQGKRYWIQRITKRKRKLGWILLCLNPFADSVEVDYHHILGAYVVAVPRDLHRLYCGKYHRENLRPVLEQIYLRTEDTC